MLPQAASRKYKLGILYVHGIGEQPEGETLLNFGEPIITWLHRWLERDKDATRRGSVTVVESVLTPSKLREHLPPHAEVRVELPGGGGEQAWLMAESWWGGDVQAPPFGKVALWMMTVGAWSILSHVAKHVRRHPRSTTRAILSIAALIQWIVLASLLQIAIVLLSLFTVLPIPGIRKRLSGILLAITGVLGDSYVLLESDIQRAAIINKTRDALRWMSPTCEKIIVVAHSQGAAIAHHALRDPEPQNVRSLVTLGSGLGKLDELLRLRERPRRVQLIARLAPVFLLLFALLVRVLVFEKWSNQSLIAAVVLGVLIALASIVVSVEGEMHWKWVESWLDELKFPARSELKWVDVYASKDPVPNGTMSPFGTAVATEQLRIRNLSSFFGDHTSYWQNRVQFVSAVAQVVAETAELPPFEEHDQASLAAAAARHERNVDWLGVIGWAALAAIVLFPVLYWSSLQIPGGWLADLLHVLGGPFGKGIGRLQSFITPAASLSALGALVWLTTVLVWRRGFLTLWRWWDNRLLDRVVNSESLTVPAERVIDFLVVTAGCAPLMLVAIWPLFARILVSTAITGSVLVGYVGLLAGALVLLIVKSVNAWPSIVRGDKDAVMAWLSDAGVFVSMGVVVALILPAFFADLAPLRELVMNAVGVFLFVGVAVGSHKKTMARVTALTRRRVYIFAAMLFPALMTSLLALRFAANLNANPKVAQTLGDRMFVFIPLLTLYIISAAAIRGFCSIAARKGTRAAV